jgi:superfamily II DNA or RNA helicase
LEIPTLVVVHKEFLMEQWYERIAEYLPGARIGKVQEDVCDYEGKHIVLGMVQTLANRDFDAIFRSWPGLVLTDEVHRVGAHDWSVVPPKFPAKFRLGLSATPRRKDGAENVFRYHIGEILFQAHQARLKPKVRVIETKFRMPKTATFNPTLLSKNLLLNFICESVYRNRLIADQMILAVKAERKLIILSERLKHLHDLEEMLRQRWQYGESTEVPSIGYYIGGTKKAERAYAEGCQVLFATSQYVQEGLDIPALDTLFLTTPLSDVEQAVGRIQRPFPGKKDPIVVDFRDPDVSLCRRYGEMRDQLYARIAA